MKRLVAMLAVVGVLVGQMSVCSAAIEFDPSGRVYSTGPYEGPGFSLLDLVWLGATYAPVQAVHSFARSSQGFLQTHNMLSVAALSTIVWGAQRTAHYREDATKSEIHANLASIARQPVPGTIREILE